MTVHADGRDQERLETLLSRRFGVSLVRGDVERALDALRPTHPEFCCASSQQRPQLYDAADFGEDVDAYRRQVLGAVTAYALLVNTAHSTADVAALLGVDPSRVRQRIKERSCVGHQGSRRLGLSGPAIRDGTSLAAGLISGLDKVFQASTRGASSSRGGGLADRAPGRAPPSRHAGHGPALAAYRRRRRTGHSRLSNGCTGPACDRGNVAGTAVVIGTEPDRTPRRRGSVDFGVHVVAGASNRGRTFGPVECFSNVRAGGAVRSAPAAASRLPRCRSLVRGFDAESCSGRGISGRPGHRSFIRSSASDLAALDATGLPTCSTLPPTVAATGPPGQAERTRSPVQSMRCAGHGRGRSVMRSRRWRGFATTVDSPALPVSRSSAHRSRPCPLVPSQAAH